MHTFSKYITKVKWLFSLTALISLIGCQTPAAPTPTIIPQPSNTPAPEKITVLLDWFPNTNHTGLYVALENGYFAEQGLDVEIIEPGEGVNTQVVAAGKAEFAVSSQESVTQARVAGIPVVSIAAIIQHNTSAFASLEESNITSVKDFEGKRYGGWGSPIEDAVLTAAMKDVGADFSKVDNITIGTTDFFTSIGRESDFQWIFYAWDGVEAERRGITLNTIMLKDLDPVLDYYTPVLMTSEDAITNNPEMIRKFMAATAQGYSFAIANPNEAASILLKHAPELNAELVKLSQDWLSPQYQADASQWGIQKADIWEGYATWLHERELIETMLDVEKAFTNDFLPTS